VTQAEDKPTPPKLPVSIRFALATALTLASITAAHAGPELPPYFQGKWCVEFDTNTYHRQERNKVCTPPDGYLHIRPNGFSMHETVCKLETVRRAVSPKFDIYYRAAFRCTELGPGTFALYYMITPEPHANTLRMEETTAKFDLFDDQVCGRACSDPDEVDRMERELKRELKRWPR